MHADDAMTCAADSATKLRIEVLRRPADLSAIGQWIFDQWARHEDASVWPANRADLLRSLDAGVTVPKFFVGRVGKRRVGCASIVAADLPTHPALGPWLANILVLPQWRGRGYGRQLARAAMAHACRHGEVLYLYTFDQVALYQHLGWEVAEADSYAGRPISIMRYRCA